MSLKIGRIQKLIEYATVLQAVWQKWYGHVFLFEDEVLFYKVSHSQPHECISGCVNQRGLRGVQGCRRHNHVVCKPWPSLQGVGMDMNDPFEQFRKNKSYTFNKRTSSSAGELLSF